MPKTLRIDSIDASGRLRPVDPDHVALIAASIEERGLEQPIVVRPAGDGYKLTIGAHRFAALKSLGWTELEVGKHVLVREEDELDAKISEIDENLARHELNALDRAVFLAERRRLYEEQRRVASKGGDRKSEKFKAQSLRMDFSPRFTEDVAERVGLSERTVQLALRIASGLDREAMQALRGTRIERNQAELLALVDLPVAQQRAAAKEIGSGAAKTVREARVVIGVDKAVANDPQGRAYAALLANWEKADAKTRRAFLKDIGAEIVKAKG
ncbi:MAG: ParB/RepB/Spo0J family partition protein [Roseiarcus sp.]|jgi:ParB family chromosome partitioning protein